MIKTVDLLLHTKLDRIAEWEEKLSHVEGHGSRKAFISDLRRCCQQGDEHFNRLVQDQLNLICGIPDPRTLVSICNTPQHVIRNRMLAWFVDHPKKQN